MSERALRADIPLGFDGLYGSKNPVTLPVSALIVANNLTYIDGTIKKEGGAQRYNAIPISGAPLILAGTDWWPTTTLQRSVILTSSGRILKDSGAGTYDLELKSGLAASTPFGAFVTGGAEAAARPRKLFCFTGVDPVQVLAGDGTTTTDIAQPPADWSGANQPLGGVVHQSRLFGFGNLNDPHRLYYSETGNHEALAQTLVVYSGVGERILAAFSLRGFLIIFKFPEGVFALDSRDVDSSKWRVDKISDEIGVASIGAAVLTERSIVFLDASGNLQLLEQVTTDAFAIGNIGATSQIKSFINLNVNLTELAKAKSAYYAKEREIHFALAHTGAATNSRRLVIDFNREVPRFRFSDRDSPVSLWLRKVDNIPKLALGDDAGLVWDLDTPARNKAGAGYAASFETAPTDLGYLDPGLSTRRKNGKFLELVFEPTGNFNLRVDLLWDGFKEDSYDFNLAGDTDRFILGAGILGKNRLGPGGILANLRQRITGSGKRIALRGFNSGVDENISLSKFILHFDAADEHVSV